MQQPVPETNFESVTAIIPATVTAEASDSEVEITQVPVPQAQDVQDVTASATGTKPLAALAILDCDNRCRDAGLWTELTKEDIAYWVEKGPEECQNASGSFQSSRRSYHHVSKATKKEKKTTKMCNTGFFTERKSMVNNTSVIG